MVMALYKYFKPKPSTVLPDPVGPLSKMTPSFTIGNHDLQQYPFKYNRKNTTYLQASICNTVYYCIQHKLFYPVIPFVHNQQ